MVLTKRILIKQMDCLLRITYVLCVFAFFVVWYAWNYRARTDQSIKFMCTILTANCTTHFISTIFQSPKKENQNRQYRCKIHLSLSLRVWVCVCGTDETGFAMQITGFNFNIVKKGKRPFPYKDLYYHILKCVFVKKKIEAYVPFMWPEKAKDKQ